MRIILALLLAAASAQAFQFPVNMRPDIPVEIDQGILGTKYRQNGKLLKPMSVLDVVEEYPEAKAEMGAVKPLLYSGVVVSAVGGVLLGYPLGQSLAGGDFNGPMFFTGVGVAAVGLVLGKMAEHRMLKGVKAYNALLSPATSLDWGWTPELSRVALRIGF